MKICIVNSFYPLVKGGAEYQAKTLAGYLKDYSEVFFISYGHNASGVEVIDGFKVYKIKLERLYDSLSLYAFSGMHINKILEKEKPDYVYQRVLNSYSYHLSHYVNKNNSCKSLLLHIADNYSLDFNLKTVRGFVRKYMFNKIYKVYKADNTKIKFLVQNTDQQDQLNKLGVDKSTLINNIHPLPTSNIINKSKSKKQIVVWIGSSRRVKRLGLYINLARKFVENNSTEFHFIGRVEGDVIEKEEVLNLMKSCGVIVHGEVDNNYINNFLLKKANILINTSLSEGFSNTFIQAWLNGVYVISLNSNPNKIFEAAPFLGKFCNNKEELLSAEFEEYIINKGTQFEYAEKAYQFAKENFSKQCVGPIFLKLLNYDN